MAHYNSSCRVIVYRYAEGMRFGGAGESEELDVSSDVIQCAYSEDTQHIVSSFSLVLKPRKAWGKIFTPESWVVIIGDDGSDDPGAFIGLVDRVYVGQQVDTGSGAVNTTVNVTGRSFGKIYMNTDLTVVLSDLSTGYGARRIAEFDDYVKQAVSDGKFSKDSRTFARADEIIEMIHGYTQSKVDQWHFPPTGKPFFQHVFSGGIETLGYSTETLSTIIVPLLNLHTLMRTFANEPFNELYTVTLLPRVGALVIPAEFLWQVLSPTLVLRPKPYDWLDMRSNTVIEAGENDVLNVNNLGLAGDDLFNFFRVVPSASDGFREWLGPISKEGIALIDELSIMRNGLRRFELSTRFWLPENARSAESTNPELKKSQATQDYGLDIVRQQTERLGRWFYNANQLYNGTITTKYKPQAHAGYVLRVTDRFNYSGALEAAEDMSFYIEGVTHVFQFKEGGSRSVFMLSRGVRTADLQSMTDELPIELSYVSSVQVEKAGVTTINEATE